MIISLPVPDPFELQDIADSAIELRKFDKITAQEFVGILGYVAQVGASENPQEELDKLDSFYPFDNHFVEIEIADDGAAELPIAS